VEIITARNYSRYLEPKVGGEGRLETIKHRGKREKGVWAQLGRIGFG